MAGGSPGAAYGRGVDPDHRIHVRLIPEGSEEPRGRLGGVRPSRVTFVVLLALLGVVLVAGITYAGSRLVSEPIGLAAEPRNLSSSLTAPAITRTVRPVRTVTAKPRPAAVATTTAPAPVITPAASPAPVATTPPPSASPVTSAAPVTGAAPVTSAPRVTTAPPAATRTASTAPSVRLDDHHDKDHDDD